ncbi:MAG: GNAT family N-acetyltransferase [Leptolyngbyaceae cyanobacterium SL_5_9]|nr:GNAT family N-acetyltransferase [Leptolyngbyaceae cyanobacterium SL_5_9]NJO76675.1 GNAT family N-acetyltransferase [Leptolyngbyaceae cyanobacterium RM1_406_9]
MMTLTMRPYAGETDLEAIAHLLNTCEAVDQLDNYYSVRDLRLEFSEPNFDAARNLRLWHDGDGKLIGFGQIWFPLEAASQELDGHLWFRVHPDARGNRLETEIIGWGEARMHEIWLERGVAVKLYGHARDKQTDLITLLENSGFTFVRQFLRMERSLTQPIPAPHLPEGFTVRHSQGEADLEAWVEMHNQSFIDHWNYHPLTIETHRHWMTDPEYYPELDLVAIAPDGTFAAFCYCHIPQEQNHHLGRNDGWIGMLGTRRGFRRMGLGRAMLLTGLQKLKAAGIEIAKLGVDTENPNRAQTLYESTGFHKAHASFSFVKPLS